MPERKLWKNCNRFSEKLGQKILQLGFNGQKLARKSEVSDSEISRIMNGKSLPGLENAIALARRGVGDPRTGPSENRDSRRTKNSRTGQQ